MSLVRKQAEFLADIARLILWVKAEADFGEDEVFFTAGDFCPAVPQGHMPGSLHYIRLAADLNLFVNGRYISGDHLHWHKIGATWKKLGPENRWGGDFRIKDFNHFSRAHNGKA